MTDISDEQMIQMKKAVNLVTSSKKTRTGIMSVLFFLIQVSTWEP